MMSGPISGAASPTLHPPSISAIAASKRVRGVGVEREQRFARGDGLTGTAVDAQTSACLHTLTGNRATRTESPHGQPHRHCVDIAHRATAGQR